PSQFVVTLTSSHSSFPPFSTASSIFSCHLICSFIISSVSLSLLLLVWKNSALIQTKPLTKRTTAIEITYFLFFLIIKKRTEFLGSQSTTFLLEVKKSDYSSLLHHFI